MVLNREMRDTSPLDFLLRAQEVTEYEMFCSLDLQPLILYSHSRILPTHPTPFTAPPSCPRRGAPLSLVSSRRPVSLPCSRRRSPGSILSRRSGEGAAGGRALPLAPLSRRTDGGDSAGLRKDPGSPGLRSGAAEFYPAPPGLRASEGAIGPDGTGRGTTGWKGLG